MTGQDLRQYRRQRKLSQEKAARALGVSQPYLSLLEKGQRHLTVKLKKKAVSAFGLSATELPARAKSYQVDRVTDDHLTADLAALGYPGFSHYKPSRPKNPADVLLSALTNNSREARLVEALPWVVLAYSDMDWDSLIKTAKLHDLQNRLGYVANVARRVAERRHDHTAAASLRAHEAVLDRSKLDREDTLCNDNMTMAERRFLKVRRSNQAKHWHLLTDLSPRYLNYA